MTFSNIYMCVDVEIYAYICIYIYGHGYICGHGMDKLKLNTRVKMSNLSPIVGGDKLGFWFRFSNVDFDTCCF